jgi:hypothetical protein
MDTSDVAEELNRIICEYNEGDLDIGDFVSAVEQLLDAIEEGLDK